MRPWKGKDKKVDLHSSLAARRPSQPAPRMTKDGPLAACLWRPQRAIGSVIAQQLSKI